VTLPHIYAGQGRTYSAIPVALATQSASAVGDAHRTVDLRGYSAVDVRVRAHICVSLCASRIRTESPIERALVAPRCDPTGARMAGSMRLPHGSV